MATADHHKEVYWYDSGSGHSWSWLAFVSVLISKQFLEQARTGDFMATADHHKEVYWYDSGSGHSWSWLAFVSVLISKQFSEQIPQINYTSLPTNN